MKSSKCILFALLSLLFSCINNPQSQNSIDIALINNKYKYVNDTRRTNAFYSPSEIQALCDTLTNYKRVRSTANTEAWREAIDSLLKENSHTVVPLIKSYEDSSYLPKSFLEKNYELAMSAYIKSGWKSSISIEDFEEYICPYKLNSEVVDNWREILNEEYELLLPNHPTLRNLDTLYQYAKDNFYKKLSSKIRLRMMFPSPFENYSWLRFSEEGDCSSRSRYMIYFLRAAGAPAAYDYIPAWGNRARATHAYVGLACRKYQVPVLIKNNNCPSSLVDDLNSTMTIGEMYFYPEKEIPNEIYIQYEKTIPKVYRQTWTNYAKNEQLLSKLNAKDIDRELVKRNMVDVTSEYLVTGDISIEKPRLSSAKIQYLSVFNTSGFTGVAFAEYNWFNDACFSDLGINVLYFPTILKDGRQTSNGTPFILLEDNQKKILTPDYERTIDLFLIRKYPLFAYSARHVAAFKNAVFEGSADSSFTNPTEILAVKNFPFFQVDTAIWPSPRIRHIRLKTVSNQIARIDRLEFYNTKETGEFKKIDFKLVRKNSLLYCTFDSAQQVSKISFIPKNDKNYIIPGNEYELMYWDNGWISAGKVVAKQSSVEYKCIPAGTVYWLKCLTEGKEERIFTYENGKQIWW